MVVSPQPGNDRYSPSERVVRVVADDADVDPLELPPLHYAIDADALDAAVDRLDDGSLSFRYAGRCVTVNGDGSVEISAATLANDATIEAVGDD